MKAAEQPGIPTAFIVNAEGKIAWISHPMEMDKPLEKIAAGKWDIKTAIAEQQKAKDDQKKLQQLVGALQSAQQAGDGKKLIATIQQIVELKPEAELALAQLKLAALIMLDQQDEGIAFINKIEKTVIGRDPEGLNMIAWTIVDPDSKLKPNEKLIAIALEWAKRADEMAKEKNGAIADTLAESFFRSGDAAKAIETEERAIKLTKQGGDPVDPSMTTRLAKYKKAAKK